MSLMKGNNTLYFDRILKAKNEFISGIKLIPMSDDIATTPVKSNRVKNKIDINNLHRILGDCGEAAIKMTQKCYEYDVTGEF